MFFDVVEEGARKPSVPDRSHSQKESRALEAPGIEELTVRADRKIKEMEGESGPHSL